MHEQATHFPKLLFYRARVNYSQKDKSLRAVCWTFCGLSLLRSISDAVLVLSTCFFFFLIASRPSSSPEVFLCSRFIFCPSVHNMPSFFFLAVDINDCLLKCWAKILVEKDAIHLFPQDLGIPSTIQCLHDVKGIRIGSYGSRRDHQSDVYFCFLVMFLFAHFGCSILTMGSWVATLLNI